jgi:enoyl-CoA hydratase
VNPMNKESVELRKKGRIAAIAFNVDAVKKRDSLHAAGRFADFCSEIASDPKIQVVVITGADENLCDLTVPENYPDPQKDAISISSIVESAASLEVPVIIGLHGFIAGQALELALACDIRIATAESQFAFPQISMGLIPFEGATQRLPRIVGAAKALEMILTGEKIDTQAAYQIGLVNRIVKPDELSAAITTMAQKMSEASVVSLRYAKEAITKGMELTLEQGLRLEADLYFLMHTTKDRKEGIKAFREKRKPQFKGI